MEKSGLLKSLVISRFSRKFVVWRLRCSVEMIHVVERVGIHGGLAVNDRSREAMIDESKDNWSSIRHDLARGNNDVLMSGN